MPPALPAHRPVAPERLEHRGQARERGPAPAVRVHRALVHLARRIRVRFQGRAVLVLLIPEVLHRAESAEGNGNGRSKPRRAAWRRVASWALRVSVTSL